MAYEFKFPDVGEGITEGELVKWTVKEGDTVKEHQTMAEVETDKAVVEIPAAVSGKILKLHFKPGDTIKVGEVMVTFGEKAAAKQKEKPVKKAPPKKKKVSVSVVGELEEAPEEKKKAEKEVFIKVRTEAKPLMARKPVEQAIPKMPKVTFEKYGRIMRVPFRGVRKKVAENMVLSATKIPHVAHMDEIDVTDLWDVREKEKKVAEKKGRHLTFLPFIIKAIIAGIKKYPYVNSSLDEENQEIIVKEYYNVGIAVDTADGLIVPVVKNVDKKSILDIAYEIEKLAGETRQRKIKLEELQGGSFTITNIGSLGGVFATPIINYPEAAILGVGRIREKPVVIKSRIVLRKMMPVSFVFDHRIFDGAYAARFVNEMKKHLEDPDLLLIDVV